MPSKFQFITELYANTLHELTHTAESWTGFLRTACYNYKCPFDEQVLIYAQRPNATAVLELDKWNKQFGRWINRGAHGIAVLSDENGMGKLKYYFDVSDTHVSSYARPLPILKMDWLYENEVIEALENTFGELKEKETLVEAVFSASRNAAADNVPDYLYDLKNCVKDSFLEELDDLNLEVRYRQLIETSVAYMLLTRLSIKADEYITREEFQNLYDFNTITTINSLGIATSDIAEMGLREISRTIMSLSKEQFFENVDKLPYDNAKEKPKADDERSRNDGSNLQNRGRVPASQPSDAPTAGSTPGQIRSAAPTVSDEAPESALHEPEDECKTNGAFGGNRKPGNGDDRADHSQNGAERRRDGTSEADRPNEMDRTHEQFPAFSGGNSPERPGLQLNISDEAGENESDSPAFLNEQLMLFGMGENTPNYEGVNSEADLPLFSEHEIPQAVISLPVPKTKVQNQSFSPLDHNGTNYHISDDELVIVSPKEKFRRNIEAIETLNRIEQSGLPATPAEQEVLSCYVGWGGLSEAFDENKPAWASEYKTLRNVLSDEEYVLARESSLTAFFTPPVVIRSICKVIENMGFAQGNILEPSCGIGNFFGSLPDSMAESKLYGIELDSISGRLAKQLYQKASITIQGFEKADIPDSFFDVVIGNVPFGQFKVADKRYDKNNFLVHDYFFAKALDKVRSGGVIAFITSKGTLDKENPSVRKYIAQRADLLGAIRLPNTTFRATAGTEVTSDIIFLQKRDRLINIEPEWVHLGTDENGITINQYFIDNPGMLMGEMKMVSGPFGPESACVPYEEQSLAEMLSDAVQNIHGKISDYEHDEDIGTEYKSIPADPTVRNFSYTLVEDELYYRENSRMYPVDVAKTADNRIRGMISLRDCVRKLIELQTEDYPDEAITAQQRTLNGLTAIAKAEGVSEAAVRDAIERGLRSIEKYLKKFC